MRIKRAVSLVLSEVADKLFLTMKAVPALAIFIFPTMIVLSILVYMPWQAYTGKPYRDHLTRAYGRLKVWRTIREIAQNEKDNREFNRFLSGMQG